MRQALRHSAPGEHAQWLAGALSIVAQRQAFSLRNCLLAEAQLHMAETPLIQRRIVAPENGEYFDRHSSAVWVSAGSCGTFFVTMRNTVNCWVTGTAQSGRSVWGSKPRALLGSQGSSLAIAILVNCGPRRTRCS